jgi:hypothetical protein
MMKMKLPMMMMMMMTTMTVTLSLTPEMSSKDGWCHHLWKRHR